MKKIIILLMGMILVFSAMSCSVDAHDDLNEKITESENTESSKDEDKSNEDEETPTAESEDEDDTDESKDDSEKEDEESSKLDESSENTETNEPKEDTEVEESKDEDDTDESDSIENINTNNDSSDNSNDENKTWCYVNENINILELNYIAHYKDSTYKFNSDINDSSMVKSMPFTMRCNASSTSEVMRVIVITVTYDNGTLNFAINSQSPYYNITNVTYDSSSTVDIYIQHN